LPNYTGFPKYPYNDEGSPAPFGADHGTTGGRHYMGPFGLTLTTSYDQGHTHTVSIPPSAFGAVGPTFRRNARLVNQALGAGVAAPMLWWASGQTSDPRARAALRAGAVGLAATNGALLAWDGYDAYRRYQGQR